MHVMSGVEVHLVHAASASVGREVHEVREAQRRGLVVLQEPRYAVNDAGATSTTVRHWSVERASGCRPRRPRDQHRKTRQPRRSMSVHARTSRLRKAGTGAHGGETASSWLDWSSMQQAVDAS
jgi:hypothetical protein